MLQQLLGSERSEFIDKRTVDSVKNEILFLLAQNKAVTGNSDFSNAIVQMIRSHLSDKEFSNALETICRKVMFLFPVETPLPDSQEAMDA